MDYLAEGKNIINQEARGLLEIAEKLDQNFEKAVTALKDCSGRIIVMGVGKSGIIGRKVASTLASTGTPAFFLHPGEASHGELGMITDQDIILIISNSGETNEILNILPSLKSMGIKIINMCGNNTSILWRNSDINLNIKVSSEADPNNLAPTTSTTAALALGDALAIVILKVRQFQPEDFAKLHPGGSLGKKLTMKVSDLMHRGDMVPKVNKDATIKEILFVLTKIGLGIAIVVESDNTLLGVFTDGDLRRLIENEQDFINIKISRVMKKNPKTISADELAYNALSKMKDFKITALVVTDASNKVIGVVNIHEILRAGIS
jgi:arabinose-5-phosphate isomerase